jgi:quercetin dioxygenase-like cupin family protein
MKYSFYDIGKSQTIAPGSILLQSNLELSALTMYKYTLARNSVVAKQALHDQVILVLTGYAEILVDTINQTAKPYDIFSIKRGSDWAVKNTGDENFSFFIVESN